MILDSAIQYAGAGFCSFPVHGITDGKCDCGNQYCTKQGKHPIIKGWKYRATNNHGKLAELFQVPDSNIGIATGIRSKLIVFDVDPKNGGDVSYQNLVKRFGKLDEDTLTANTGGGGFHLYYRYEGDQIGNYHGTVFGNGIDIKGNGGYVVGAPSTHLRGREYEWRDGFHLPPLLYEDLEQEIVSVRGTSTAERSGPRWAKSDIFEGNRNHRLAQIAGHHRAKGHERDEIESRLLKRNFECCKPPLPEQEVKQIAQSISKYPKGASKVTWKEYWLSCLYNDSCALSLGAKGVLTALSRLMDNSGGNCTATQDLIALKANTSRQTVSKHINIAREKGWLHITHMPKTNGTRGIYCSYVATMPNCPRTD